MFNCGNEFVKLILISLNRQLTQPLHSRRSLSKCLHMQYREQTKFNLIAHENHINRRPPNLSLHFVASIRMRDRTCHDIDDNQIYNSNKIINNFYATQNPNWCLIRTTPIYLYEWLNPFIFFNFLFIYWKWQNRDWSAEMWSGHGKGKSRSAAVIRYACELAKRQYRFSYFINSTWVRKFI